MITPFWLFHLFGEYYTHFKPLNQEGVIHFYKPLSLFLGVEEEDKMKRDAGLYLLGRKDWVGRRGFMVKRRVSSLFVGKYFYLPSFV